MFTGELSRARLSREHRHGERAKARRDMGRFELRKSPR